MHLAKTTQTVTLVLLACSMAATPALSKPNTTVKTSLTRAENPKQGTESTLILPYAFSTESMGLTMGVGGGMKGYIQDQVLVSGTVFGSVEGAVAMFAGIWDYRPTFANRFFFSAKGMIGHYPEQRAYTALAFRDDVARPGGNDSDQEQYAEDSGYDNWSDFKIEYVLPMGSGRSKAVQDIKIKGGLLQSAPVGGSTWNPLEHGVTTLMLRQYNQYRSFEFDQGDIDATMHPVQLALAYDNTDFPTNPSAGSLQYIGVTHDFGWLESPDDWTFMEFETSKYYSLGSSNWAKQRIIALNMWTGSVTSWEEHTNSNGITTVSNRPPFYEGATLGGFYRMRGYPVDRFNDKSVLYTTAEYRYTLDWNPLGNISWLKFLQNDWLQLVGFVEGGRVANDYGDLFSDWKVDGGVGLRGMFAGAVVRLDVGMSDESTSAWAMIGHPF